MTDPQVLEPIAARGWPAAEIAKLGGWRPHAPAGPTNTSAPRAAPPRDIDAAIAAPEAWCGARGFAPRFKIVEGCSHPPDLAERLGAGGPRRRPPPVAAVGAPAARG